MSRSRLPLLFALLLVAPACSSDKTPPPGNPADGSTSSDGSNTSDGAASGDGALSSGDATASDGPVGSDAGRTDASSPADATVLPPECEAFAACCPELPLGQAQCETTAAAGDAARCTQGLNLAQSLGYCTGGDGGPPLDAGPQGPICAELESCCTELSGVAQMVCLNRAARHVESECQQGLDLARNQGACLGDAGTSTTTLDAGGSSTTDAAINLDAGAGNG
ncbi:MAG: hypothetical protein IT384_09170 [Deltaproteobacteria bacterium]|nr:hypothetical protein [Deltaproteobacteria bacterium]